MKLNKNILYLDSAMAACSVGVLKNGHVNGRIEPMKRGQSERIIPLVNEVMGEAGCDYSELGAIVTTVGPGAFTGVRIALSAAKAFGLSLEIPVYGITTFQALNIQASSRYPSIHNIDVVIDTRRDDFYFQSYVGDQARGEPRIVSTEDIVQPGREGFVLIGDLSNRMLGGSYVHEDQIFVQVICPDPKGILDWVKCHDVTSLQQAEPFYIRGADVQMQKKIVRNMA
ncbi:MAG: tRNA (adenosine(37)-N6)-threonylcarbamoyltransferase complex dimerization subunit type 1 TsaB [Micavibrio sp.]|nr:tRNA (adenosine(37)-N6)-threonylcarbamoyltransferase complex dimerization subunit type 1 TsaB [Micavibrio sp.]